MEQVAYLKQSVLQIKPSDSRYFKPFDQIKSRQKRLLRFLSRSARCIINVLLHKLSTEVIHIHTTVFRLMFLGLFLRWYPEYGPRLDSVIYSMVTRSVCHVRHYPSKERDCSCRWPDTEWSVKPLLSAIQDQLSAERLKSLLIGQHQELVAIPPAWDLAGGCKFLDCLTWLVHHCSCCA